MISHSKRFIFVHVPRTGGTLIEAGLRDHGIVLQGKDNYESVYFKHASARAIKRLMGAAYDEYFKFGLVRNPWDWVVSNFAYNRGMHHCYVAGTPHEALRTPGRMPDWAKDMPFERWLRWWLDELRPGQLELMEDEAGKLLVDEVYRFENMHEDRERLCRRLGVEFVPRAVNTRARSKRGDYRGYFTAETREWVARHFRKEIETFAYTFE